MCVCVCVCVASFIPQWPAPFLQHDVFFSICFSFSAFCSSVFCYISLNQFKNVSPCYWWYTSERTLTFSYREYPVMKIFAEASGVHMLEYLYSNICGSGLGMISLIDNSKRFTKMYSSMCFIFPVPQGCEIYGSWDKSRLLPFLSFFW